MKTTPSLDVRAQAIAAAAAQWRDANSDVRVRARRVLADNPWPAQQVDAALDNALWDLDEPRALAIAQDMVSHSHRALVFLPGNVLGPALQSAFCAAIARTPTVLKTSSAERQLAHLVSDQLSAFEPLAGLIEARDFGGGDLAAEAEAFDAVDRIIAFGDDDTIEQIRARAGERDVIGYGASYSIAYVGESADLGHAVACIARDACLFDQRGCMSPQTVYLAGEPGRALRFTHALALAMRAEGALLPRARFEAGEQALVSDFVRRLAATAMAPNPHGL
ncbi:MAG: hypothetical protein JO347_08415, partial [Candidatus Eremiobacteraeota bacterium]|nr:hypothetical protein [Candidatus Eremiobacteraeota bacterium]